jgi:hypothetical protein
MTLSSCALLLRTSSGPANVLVTANSAAGEVSGVHFCLRLAFDASLSNPV